MTRLMAIVWLTAALAAHQPEKQPANPAPAAPAPAPAAPTGSSPASAEDEIRATWGKRLEALTPERPMEYFLLGEEVAADAEGGAGRDLARKLFVLAYELDSKRGGSGAGGGLKLGPSSCLALASIAARDDERRWLKALAETMSDLTHGAGQAAPDGGAGHPMEAAFDLATAMGMARAGEGRRAEQLLEKPETAQLLEKIDSGPMPNGSTSELRHYLKRALRDWPVCPQCRNRRVVPAGASRHGEMILCDTCRGNPGPKTTEVELADHLRIESMLLQGTQRSWAAQVLFDDGAPLRDLDPAELSGTYGVDASKPLWRNGAWVGAAPASAPTPSEPGS